MKIVARNVCIGKASGATLHAWLHLQHTEIAAILNLLLS